MLDQVIYTRCSLHRDLKNDGRVLPGDGFAVYSMNQEMMQHLGDEDIDFLNTRFSLKNASDELDAKIGLLHSYEYGRLPSGTGTLTREDARPLCKEPRRNGRGHRLGTYIKQCLIGEAQGYPYEWFGAVQWNACAKSENDYYHDDAASGEPPWLAQMPAKPFDGTITEEQIRDFTADGRREAVKSAVWFLIHEMAKPVDQQRVLLIKDLPENVELWIAAITCGFSEKMAQQLTFTTNITNLNNGDSVLFYYTDANGRYLRMRGGQQGVTRHAYYLIAGYHPNDRFSGMLYATANSNYVIVDGVQKKALFETDDDIRQSYYDMVADGGAGCRRFGRDVLGSLSKTSISPDIPKLYDDAVYLFGPPSQRGKWTYDRTIDHVRSFLRYGLPKNEAIVRTLYNQLMTVYPSWLTNDMQHQFSALHLLADMAAKLDEGDAVQQMAERLLTDLILQTSSQLPLCAKVIAGDSQWFLPVLDSMFAEEKTDAYIREMQHASNENILAIVMLFTEMLGGHHAHCRYFQTHPKQYQFLNQGMIFLLNDPVCLEQLLRRVIRLDWELLYMSAVTVAEFIEATEPKRLMQWWDTVVSVSDGNVMALCSKLSTMQQTGISVPAQKKIFKMIDENLPLCQVDNLTIQFYNDLWQWGQRLGLTSRSVILWDVDRRVTGAKHVEACLACLRKLMQCGLQMPPSFIKCEYGRHMVEKAVEYANGEMHVTILCLFGMLREERKKYIEDYVNQIIDRTKERHLVSALLSLSEAVEFRGEIPGAEPERIRFVQQALAQVLNRKVHQHYKHAMIKQVRNNEDYEWTAKSRLIQIMETIEGEKPTGGIGKIFDRFRKK